MKDNPSAYTAAMNRGLFSARMTVQLAERLQYSSFDQALVDMSQKEIQKIKTHLGLSMQAIAQGVTVALFSVAVVLGLGIMTIGTALEQAANAPRHIQSHAHPQGQP